MNHKNIIPDGYQIFEERLEVAGIHYRRDDAVQFANSRNKWIEFQREPENRSDKNAIKVIGCSKGFFGTLRRFIGYVPKEVSKKIIENGFYDFIIPRLMGTFIGDNEFVGIYFQILGPKGKKFNYDPPKTEEGGHYTEYVDRVTQLKNEKKYEEAIQLLLRLVKETEEESIKEGWSVAPWYYEQLAIIYRKRKQYVEEVMIIERFNKQIKPSGTYSKKLSDRLEKAKKLMYDGNKKQDL